MKIKPKHFILDTAMFKQDILVCINKYSKDVNKILKHYNIRLLDKEQMEWIDEKTPGTAVMLINSSCNHKIVCLFPRDKAELITLFDHEKIHVLHHIMDKIGMGKLNSDTEEAFAYTSEYLMSQFLKKA